MAKFDQKTSEEAARNWIDSTIAGIEKEDFLLSLNNNKLQPEHRKLVKTAREKILALLVELDEIRGEIQ